MGCRRPTRAQRQSASNPEAFYALDQLGQLRHDRGRCLRRARGVAGGHRRRIRANRRYEQMMPEPEKRRQREAYPPGLPPELNPASILRTGIEVLEHGSG
jgi:hypothetical protein